MEECTRCPAYAKCIWNHGGLACIALRRSYGVEVMTNADRIRGMSDDELAAFLTKHDVEQNRLRLASRGIVATAVQLEELIDRAYSLWTKWLRQPVQPTPDVPDTHEHSGLLEDWGWQTN